MKKGLYIIRDTVGRHFYDGIQVHAADAAAVRSFVDTATDERPNLIKNHVTDHELVRIAYINVESGEILPPRAPEDYSDDHWSPVVVLTGAQWKAAQDAFNAQQEGK